MVPIAANIPLWALLMVREKRLLAVLVVNLTVVGEIFKHSKRKQQGVALITALLVVALATIIAVEMVTRQQLEIRRTESVINGDQAYQYALGGESWVTLILLSDGRRNKVDHLKEMWATTLPSLPIEGGYLQARLEDLQSRFNLNNLLDKEGQISPKDVAYFERLLKLLDLSPTLAQAVIDWIDHDSEPQFPNGAEDNVYLTKNPAYRPANRLLTHRSELRLIHGFDQESYDKLVPYIVTLPSRTPINVNTAPALILRALAPEIQESEISSLLVEREDYFFSSVQEFLVYPAFAGLKLPAEQLAVESHFFRLMIEVQVGRGTAQLASVLQRSNNEVKIISRHQGLLTD